MDRTVNLSSLKEMVGDDPEVIQEMLEIFCQDVPNYLAAIDKGLAEDDWSVIASATHTLKSTLGFTGRGDLVDMAEKLQYQKTKPEDIAFYELLNVFKVQAAGVLQEIKEMLANKDF